MCRRTPLAALAAVVVGLALAVPLAPVALAAPTPLPARHRSTGSIPSPAPWCTQWRIVASPQPSGMNSSLAGVTAVASNNVWAVGSATSTDGSVQETLIEHYDGSAWSIVSSPNATTSDSLQGVVALAANNVWAVGSAYVSSSVGNATLVEHYDGSAWSLVTTPAIAGDAELYAVAADAANDVWAVGLFQNASYQTEPLTEHFDGTTWSIVSAPGPTGLDWFNGVSVVAGQAFAVGNSGSSPFHTLAEHYTAGSWSLMTTPDTARRAIGPHGGLSGYTLTSVVALSPTNVWAVGNSLSVSLLDTTGLIEHWDGTSWSVVANGSTLPTSIAGVAAVPGTTNLWAAGNYGTGDYTSNTFAEQWRGNVWEAATVAAPANSSSGLSAIAAISVADAWAVGSSADNTSGAGQTLIEHYTLSMGIACPYP